MNAPLDSAHARGHNAVRRSRYGTMRSTLFRSGVVRRVDDTRARAFSVIRVVQRIACSRRHPSTKAFGFRYAIS